MAMAIFFGRAQRSRISQGVNFAADRVERVVRDRGMRGQICSGGSRHGFGVGTGVDDARGCRIELSIESI